MHIKSATAAKSPHEAWKTESGGPEDGLPPPPEGRLASFPRQHGPVGVEPHAMFESCPEDLYH